jgi:hypothetical protein
MITQSKLKEYLHYDPETGIFTWIKKPSKKVLYGCVAGFANGDGYPMIGVLGKYYRSHRLAWLYMTGSMPDFQIDHIDMDKKNNSWKNLRAATNSQNSMNRKANKNNLLGCKNISKTKWNQYVVKIQANGVVERKGFLSISDAIKYAEIKRLEMHGDFANH